LEFLGPSIQERFVLEGRVLELYTVSHLSIMLEFYAT